MTKIAMYKDKQGRLLVIWKTRNENLVGEVFNDGVENGAREVALSEIADASTFNDCWSKEDGKLTWKGATDTAFSSVVKVA
jgi:hypothetical protein